LMSWRECSKAALVRATTSSSEMGVGASLLMASGHVECTAGELGTWLWHTCYAVRVDSDSEAQVSKEPPALVGEAASPFRALACWACQVPLQGETSAGSHHTPTSMSQLTDTSWSLETRFDLTSASKNAEHHPRQR
jgi:hypothetical protein